MKKSEIEKYIKEIELIIPLNTKEQREFINILKNRIINSDINDYNSLIEHFGKPSEVAASFLENMDTNTLIKKLKHKNYIRWIVSIIIICIITISFLKSGNSMNYMKKSNNNNQFKLKQQLNKENRGN